MNMKNNIEFKKMNFKKKIKASMIKYQSIILIIH